MRAEVMLSSVKVLVCLNTVRIIQIPTAKSHVSTSQGFKIRCRTELRPIEG